MSKQRLLTIAAAVYCGCLLISNIIAGKTFDIGIASLPCAVVIFPIVYILNDVLTEIFGFKTARVVVFTGFAVNLVAVAAYAVTIILPGSAFFDGQSAFEVVLGNTPRLLVASLTAYIVGSLANAKLMQVMKRWSQSRLMLRCVTSTLVGEGLDATIFITIGFIGTMDGASLVTMIIAQALFKTLYEIVVYPITRAVIMWARGLKDVPQDATSLSAA